MLDPALTNGSRLCLSCNSTFDVTFAKCPSDGSQLVFIDAGQPTIDVVPGFDLLEEIGHGATGRVYRAVHTASGTVVAMKVLHQSLLDQAELVGRFNREAELTSRLSSPQTVAVREFGWLVDGRPYIAMDHIQGYCASSLLESGFSVPLGRALPIFAQVASGLAHAHAQGVMHRDIKPNNIMLVVENGVHDIVKIVDFGIAKSLAGTDAVTLTRAGEALGSPVYMSPEQCSGGAIDHRTDIYSLGCVMYELLSGRPIFEADSPFEMMTKQIHDVPQSLGLQPSAQVAEIERIIFKAVAKNPADRYQRADELQLDLQNCMQMPKTISPTKKALDTWQFYSC